MARILSSPWSIIRGSIAGTTYFANQFHQIVARARTAPVQPGTLFQAIARSAINGAESAWAGTPKANQDDWDLYAAQTPFSGPLGPYTVPGRQMFIAGRALKLYIDRRTLAIATFDETAPPVMAGFLNIQPSVSVPVGPGTGIALSVIADASSPTLVMVQVSAAFTKERNRYKGPWDNAKSVAAVIPAAATVLLEILGLHDGGIYFTRAKAVADDAPERISAEFFSRHIAVTIP